MKETDILMYLTPHPNLLSLHGICTDVGELSERGVVLSTPRDQGLVFPYYSGGSLKDFLKEYRTSPFCFAQTLIFSAKV